MGAPLQRSTEWYQSMAKSVDALRVAAAILSPAQQKILDARLEHDKVLAKAGEVLTVPHPVANEIQAITSQLNYPADTEVIAVDSEEFLGYFHPLANRIVISRGLLMYLSKNVKDFNIDHVAAVLAHEKQHALAEDAKPIKNFDSNAEMYLATHSPAEELRADAEGMQDMARSGFNPKAMRDVLVSFGLRSGRYDSAHPEILDRVHHLDNRMIDDEHPVTHTTQPYKRLSQVLKKWCTEKSSVYEETEQYLVSSSPMLQTKVLEAVSLDEFEKSLSVKRHKEAIGNLQVLAEHPLVDKVWTDGVLDKGLNKLIIALLTAKADEENLRQWENSVLNKNIDQLLESLKISGLPLTKSRDVIDKVEELTTARSLSIGIRALPFQEEQSPLSPSERLKSQFVEKISTSADVFHIYVGQVIERLEQHLADVKLQAVMVNGKSWIAFLQEIKSAYQTRALSQDLIRLAYADIDNDYVAAEKAVSDQELSSRGRRSADKSTQTWDLKNVDEVAQLQASGRMAIANGYCSAINHLQAEQDHFQQLLVRELPCDPLTAEKLAQWRFGHLDMAAWETYLHELSTAQLANVMRAVKELQSCESQLRFSPMRDMHKAASLSLSNNIGLSKIEPQHVVYHHHFRSGGIDNIGSGLTAFSYQIAWEIYSRAYPAGYFDSFVSYRRPNELALTEQEWAVIGSCGLSFMEEEYRYFALQKFLAVNGQRDQLNPELWEVLVEQGGFPLVHEHEPQLSWAEIAAFVPISPWSPEDTQEHMREFMSQNQIGGDLSSIKDKESVRVFLKSMYELSKSHPVKNAQASGRTNISSRVLANGVLDITIAIEREKDAQESLVDIIGAVLEQGVQLEFGALSKYLFSEFAHLDPSERNRLRAKVAGFPTTESPSFAQVLEISLLLPTVDMWAFRSMRNNKVPVKFIDECIASYGVQETVQRLCSIIPASALRDEYLVCIWEKMSRDTDQENFAWLVPFFSSSSPDARGGRKSPIFNAVSFRMNGASEYELDTRDSVLEKQAQDVSLKRFGKDFNQLNEVDKEALLAELKTQAWNEHIAPYMGQGIIKEQFPDLLWRRMSFATQGGVCHSEVYGHSYFSDDDDRDYQYAKPLQRFWAKKLVLEESKIWVVSTPLEQCSVLLEIAPQASVVRDLYVERIMKSFLESSPSESQILSVGKKIWQLFSAKSVLASPLAHRIIEASWTAGKHAQDHYTQTLQLILQYLPDHSLSRNYFLDRLEAESDLTAQQLKDISKLRISPEGQKEINENSPWVFVFRVLGELSRQERMKMYLWLTGLSKEKPITVQSKEEDFYGHADSFPKAFALLTPPERAIIINRLSLGVDGIFDREAANDQDQVQQEQKVFFATIAEGATNGSKNKQLQELFVDLLSALAPANGARLLSKLTDKIAEAKKSGLALSPAKVSALVLAECGVVGKKVAQTLAEMEGVAPEYRSALRTTQKDAEAIPKRAMAEMAESDGLLSDKHGVQIISFGRLLGAASNKQACLLTVNITDRRFGLPLGINQVVGKFKRPSAQKEDNVHHDLKVMHTLVESLEKSGTAVPKGFERGITQSVVQELRFGAEVSFAEQLRQVLPVTEGKYNVGIPTILYASEDIVLETLAPGISYRELQDQMSSGLVDQAYRDLDKKRIDQAIFKQALKQLLWTGKIHADLHPGNIFVAPDTQITMIDLGMNLQLTDEQLVAVRKLLMGLTSGSVLVVNRSLADLGWPVDLAMALKQGRFSGNIDAFLSATQRVTVDMPPLLASLFNALAKLSPLSQSLSSRDITAAIFELAHVELQHGVRKYLRQLWS